MCFSDQLKASTKFEIDQDIVSMRKCFSQAFYEAFANGYNDYIEGNWERARDKFSIVEAIKGQQDYPTRQILGVMEENHFKAPQDWEGYRVLTEK